MYAIRSYYDANNPWLQELPDPVAKISWDNYASVPVAYAEENGLQNESVININGMELPVFIQPGQAKDTVAVAFRITSYNVCYTKLLRFLYFHALHNK